MIEELISRVFYARNAAHFAHWRAKGEGSFAKHMALGEFYDGVIDLADKFAETYQGRHGLIGPISLQSATTTNSVVDFLEDSLKTIEDMRYEVCDKSESAIQNIIDEIVSLYLTTLYKLKFLA